MKRTIALVSRHVPSLLAVAVIVVPVALVAPRYITAEMNRVNGNRSVFSPPPLQYHWPEYNEALAAGVVAHVPAHASVAVVGPNLALAWTRWVAYVIAPRQLTNGRAQWTMIYGKTPQQAHFHPIHSWRYGADWLVEG